MGSGKWWHRILAACPHSVLRDGVWGTPTQHYQQRSFFGGASVSMLVQLQQTLKFGDMRYRECSLHDLESQRPTKVPLTPDHTTSKVSARVPETQTWNPTSVSRGFFVANYERGNIHLVHSGMQQAPISLGPRRTFDTIVRVVMQEARWTAGGTESTNSCRRCIACQDTTGQVPLQIVPPSPGVPGLHPPNRGLRCRAATAFSRCEGALPKITRLGY